MQVGAADAAGADRDPHLAPVPARERADPPPRAARPTASSTIAFIGIILPSALRDRHNPRHRRDASDLDFVQRWAWPRRRLRCWSQRRHRRGERPAPSGSGDSFFPHLGNGGYDVGHYDVELAYAPKRGAISGAVTIAATATQELSQLQPRHAALAAAPARSRVERRPAPLPGTRRAKLFVTPPARDRERRRSSRSSIRYRGRPKPVDGPGRPPRGLDPDTGDGAHRRLRAARGRRAGSPPTSSLTDKATWELRVRRPEAAEGGLQRAACSRSRASRRASAVWRWAESQPMVRLPGDGRDRALPPASAPASPACPRSSRWIPGVADRAAEGHQAHRGHARPVQRQVRPLPVRLDRRDRRRRARAVPRRSRPRPARSTDFPPKGGIHAHEIAHQWFGDSVGFARWQDIWLAEGFAQWSMWLWRDHVGQQSLELELPPLLLRSAGSFGFYWRPAPGAVGTPAQAVRDLRLRARRDDRRGAAPRARRRRLLRA